MAAAGFVDIETHEEDVGYFYPDFAAYWENLNSSVLRIRFNQLGEEKVAALKADLADVLSGAFDGEGLYQPNALIFSRGRKG